MNSDPKVAILLSTFNGATFLSAQLDSILAQTYVNFVIVIRDDGSSDPTPELISRYKDSHPDQIHVVSTDKNNLGASGSFSSLIDYVLENKFTLGLENAYMMFCDQDDIWFENKIEKQLEAILAAEQGSGESPVPVLVHSDLEVVSQENELIADSFISYQGLEIERNQFANMVISNLVTGCTAIINEALARRATPVSKHAIMHDWWLALVAAAFGRVVFLNQPLVYYRQHASNTIGAKEFIKPEPGSRSFWQRLFARKPNEHLFEVARQAREFRQRFGSELSFRENLGLRISGCMSVRIGIIQRIFYRIARRF
ncbi:MAG: glycosyltransferase family 2 protein [Gammaproteobacteria bacterium]|nr:glycosyltransferase family 2 protein [Gammaproteobacteria bacterium]